MSDAPADFNPKVGLRGRSTGMRLLFLLAVLARGVDDPSFTATAQFDDV